MSKVVYISKSRIERKRGPVRIAHLPGEPQPVVYSVHDPLAEHYEVDPGPTSIAQLSAENRKSWRSAWLPRVNYPRPKAHVPTIVIARG